MSTKDSKNTQPCTLQSVNASTFIDSLMLEHAEFINTDFSKLGISKDNLITIDRHEDGDELYYTLLYWR